MLFTRSSELMEKSRQSRIEEYISTEESHLQTATNRPYLIKKRLKIMMPNQKNIMTRYSFIILVMVLIGIAIICKAGVIMFAERQYWKDVADRFVKENVTVRPTRGNIISSDGQFNGKQSSGIQNLYGLQSRRPSERLITDALYGLHL